MSQIGTEMNDDVVDSIAKLAREATETEIVRLPGGLEYARRAGGLFEVRDIPAPLRKERLATPADLLAFVQKVEGEPGIPGSQGRDPAVFFDEEEIVYVYDLDDPRAAAYCTLIPSEVWKLLQSIHNTRFNQVNFVDLLRVTLRGCITDGGELLSMCRKVNFNTAGQAQGVVDHTRQSMAKSLLQEVSGFETFPEEIKLNVLPFENFTRRVPVDCALKVNPADQSFQIIPYPLELRLAMDETLNAIRELFVGKDDVPPIFRGKPTRIVDPFKNV